METTNAQAEVVEQAQVINETINESSNTLTYEQKIKKILGNGGKRINNIRVKNIKCTPKDNYLMISFTLDKAIPGYIQDIETGEWKEGLVNTVFISDYAMAGALKEDENLAWLANSILDASEKLKEDDSNQNNLINMIFNGSKIDIVQQPIAAGETYINPFTTRADATGTEFDHDTIINNIVSFTLGKEGNNMKNLLAKTLMGF